MHFETSEVVERLRFRPNVEVGVGDNLTLVALNFEFVYELPPDAPRLPAALSMWHLYVGGGPSLNILRFANDSTFEGGFEGLVGIRSFQWFVRGSQTRRAQESPLQVRRRLHVSSLKVDGERYAHRVSRRRPGRALLRDRHEAARPRHEIVVVERNRPYDTFGWGVVLSDETLANLDASDPDERRRDPRARSSTGTTSPSSTAARVTRSSGHGFCGIGRKRLLNILQDRARALGVELQFETEFESADRYRDYDLIVAADGVNSQDPRRAAPTSSSPTSTCAPASSSGSARSQNSTTPSPSSSRRPSTAGSGRTPTSSTPTPRPSSSNAREATWRRFGLDAMSQEETIAACERIFAKHLDGHRADDQRQPPARLGLAQLSAACCARRWSHENLVLMGDAAATAHFSVGSGTKLALESAIALAEYLHSRADAGRRPSSATRTSAASRC